MLDYKKFLIILLVWNLFVCLVFGIDKFKAKKNRWRIPEKFLLALAIFMGSFGALIGMKIFNHKTNNKLFLFGMPLAIILNIYIFIKLKNYIII
ncbi:MAG: DUF1294 domain-containing protein [Tissierellia bacterium]|nr:DUF1294 domain-containing protein [Tissierellia bacterium]